MAFTSLSCSTEPVDDFELQLLSQDEPPSYEANDICVDNDPEVRITNNGNVAIHLDVYDSDENLLGFVHNLQPGDTSEWVNFPVGTIMFSVTKDLIADEKIQFEMSKCMIFEMEIDIDNLLTDAEPESI
ncbi:MAG: hypothetical protein HKO94_05690 [Flavobacteriaceae bacterium]|nr:hypothetical protein [Flavobacteriaceae bacterium]